MHTARHSLCGSLVAQIISRSSSTGLGECPSPPPSSFHNMMCFFFCVFFDPPLAARLLCGEARVRVALLCYFWQQGWLVAVEGRGDRKGYSMETKIVAVKGFLSEGIGL